MNRQAHIFDKTYPIVDYAYDVAVIQGNTKIGGSGVQNQTEGEQNKNIGMKVQEQKVGEQFRSTSRWGTLIFEKVK